MIPARAAARSHTYHISRPHNPPASLQGRQVRTYAQTSQPSAKTKCGECWSRHLDKGLFTEAHVQYRAEKIKWLTEEANMPCLCDHDILKSKKTNSRMDTLITDKFLEPLKSKAPIGC